MNNKCSHDRTDVQIKANGGAVVVCKDCGKIVEASHHPDCQCPKCQG